MANMMNERILELADKAIEDIPGAWNIPDEFCKKFAELIVEEMCNVLDREQWNIGRDWICDDGTRIIPKVKEHFGVE